MAPGLSVEHIDCAMAKINYAPGYIRGTVTATGGAVLENIRIRAHAAGETVAETTSGADGTYELKVDVPSGPAAVSFEDPLGRYQPQWYDQTGQESAAATLDLRAGTTFVNTNAVLDPVDGEPTPSAGATTVAGKVSFPGGIPAQGFEVSLVVTDGSGNILQVSDATGPDGAYEILAPTAPGQVSIVACALDQTGALRGCHNNGEARQVKAGGRLANVDIEVQPTPEEISSATSAPATGGGATGGGTTPGTTPQGGGNPAGPAIGAAGGGATETATAGSPAGNPAGSPSDAPAGSPATAPASKSEPDHEGGFGEDQPWPAAQVSGSAWGDVHIRTFDNLRYNFHAAGEFLGVRSTNDDLELQLRLKPFGVSARVSATTAAAARIAGKRVTVATGREQPLWVDGEPVTMQGGTLDLGDGARAVIRKPGRRAVELSWPDGSTLTVDVFRTYINATLAAAPSRKGALVGLYGNFDGDRSNDIVTRAGVSLPAKPTFEQLYDQFATGWRITQEESLFDYGTGESTATFAIAGFPRSAATVAALTPAQKRHASEVCQAAGLTNPDVLEACTEDVGHSGDDSFAEAAAVEQERAAALPEAGAAAVTVTLEAPSETVAASPVPIHVRGPAEAPNWVLFAPVGSGIEGRPGNAYSMVSVKGGDQDLTLRAPFRPGEYELRYQESRGRQRRILIRKPFRSIAPKVRIDAPDVARAGSSLGVHLTGDLTPFSIVTVVPAASPDTTRGESPQSTGDGTDMTRTIRRLPAQPGQYEIRYGIVSLGLIHARKPLTIQ